jgi:signal transduction histidine kinase
LREALSGRDELLSIATHELKTPLTSLNLVLQLLDRLANKQESVSSKDLLQMIQPMQRQMGRLTKLIDNLMDLSRIRHQGGLVLAHESFDLCEIVQEIGVRYQPQALWRGSPLTVDAPEPVVGRFDRFRLEQVIGNLVINAIKYGEGKPIRLSLQKDGFFAVIRVIDQGIGIAPADQERIFGRFERATAELQTQSLGLGLYIVHEIVKAHRGTIEVASEPGKGAAFTIHIPLKLMLERPPQ